MTVAELVEIRGDDPLEPEGLAVALETISDFGRDYVRVKGELVQAKQLLGELLSGAPDAGLAARRFLLGQLA